MADTSFILLHSMIVSQGRFCIHPNEIVCRFNMLRVLQF
jgi:hypothetical protein